MAKGVITSVLLTSLVSCMDWDMIDRFRMSVGPKVHFLSFGVGVSSGLLYGMLTSSQYSL